MTFLPRPSKLSSSNNPTREMTTFLLSEELCQHIPNSSTAAFDLFLELECQQEQKLPAAARNRSCILQVESSLREAGCNIT